MRHNRIMLAALPMLIAGIAPAAAQEQPAEQQAAATTASVERTAEGVPVIAPPPPGKGQIVFYRTSRMGFAVNCTVREGEEVLSRLNAGRYFVHVTTPGAHTYRVRSESHDVLNMEVEEGETQYARCTIGAGFLVGRPNLSPGDADDFQRRGRGIDPMPPREEQVRRTAERGTN
jgi:hypothetical protein